MLKTYPRLILFGLLFAILWSFSLYYFYEQIIQLETANINKIALREAQVAYQKDFTYRRWASSLGGVYAEVSTKLKPNPYLDVPNRDITTTNGKKLTLVNPAYMTRMVYNLMKQEAGLTAHITSLNPIRPENAPTKWEAQFLKSFTTNPVEVHKFSNENGKPVLHYMSPMITEKGCLKCHEKQGYKLGEIRGGISVTVPMIRYEETLSTFKIETGGSFKIIWTVGMAFIFVVFILLYRKEKTLNNTQDYLSNIINSMPSVLVGIDTAGTITQWNTEAEKTSKINSREALGMKLSKALPYLETEIEIIITTMLNQTIQKKSIQLRTDNGKTCYEEITIYPLITNGITGTVVRIDDITERVKIEQLMVQSEKMTSIGALAAGMAHEINNPLAAILGYSQNLQRRTFGDLKQNEEAAVQCGISHQQVRQYLKHRQIPEMITGIIESGTRAAKIVSNMLNFSRKSEKKHSYQNLPELLDKTLDLASNDYNLKKYYDFKKIKIIKEYDENLPQIFCDGNEIQQVLLNLLKNGAEAMTEKKYTTDQPRFICKITATSNMAVIKIEDNGPGIEAGPLNRIFDPFFTTKEIGKGTGLGLSVSYFIIKDQHNGSIEVDSVPGKGTAFTIQLPIIQSKLQSHALEL